MDMRNSSDFSDKNTIIYGHHLNVSPDMFSRLNLYKDESFCEEHPDFYIYNSGWKRAHIYGICGRRGECKVRELLWGFATDEEYEQFLSRCSADSNYQVDVELKRQSQIITWSYMYRNGHANRFVGPRGAYRY